MAPHLTAHELDRISDLSRRGWATVEIHSKLSKERAKQGTCAPDPTTVRRAVRGATHRRGVVETRGAKKKLKPPQLRRIDRVRKEMLQKAKGEYEVHISDVMAKARIRHVTVSTVSKHFKKHVCVLFVVGPQLDRPDGEHCRLCMLIVCVCVCSSQFTECPQWAHSRLAIFTAQRRVAGAGV